LVLLVILFLFVTWRQISTEPGSPSHKLVQAYLQEVAAEPVHTLADKVLGAEFIPREVTAQETGGLFSRFAAAYRPSVPTEAETSSLAKPEPLEAVLAQEKRLVLLGEAGMGKTLACGTWRGRQPSMLWLNLPQAPILQKVLPKFLSTSS
jgi:hypothetical protein